MEYLVFRLYGPLASWGEIAIGESRHSASYPGKSALLGLLAAALGIRRTDEERQTALAEGYRFAVKLISSGFLLRDYHTTQVPDSAGKTVYRTRRDELVNGRPRLGTILSSREYRCDAMAIIAVTGVDEFPWPLHELQAALLSPRFHLYLGRKSCPLAAPLYPIVVSAGGFGQALDQYPSGSLYLSDPLLRKVENDVRKASVSAGPLIEKSPMIGSFTQEDQHSFFLDREQVRYYWEGDAGDMVAQQVLTRYDQPISRIRWQFSPRPEQLRISGEEG